MNIPDSSQHYINGSHIPSLDGIRGIAVLLVMLHHFALYGGMQPETPAENLFCKTLLLGWAGVDLFFVLSGFLITGILIDARNSDHYFRNFYIRRILRIFPLYYATLIVAFGILPRLITPGDEFRALIQDQLWYWSYLVNWKIGIEGWPPLYILGHFWSLAVEEQFYLVWPIVVYFLPERRLRIMCIVIIAGSLCIRIGLCFTTFALAYYVTTPARMDSLAIGALLFLLIRQVSQCTKWMRWRWPMAAGWLAAIVSILILKPEQTSRIAQTLGLPSMFFGAVLWAAATQRTKSVLGRFFSNRILVYIGRYSYALYVFHHPVVLIMQSWGIRVSDWPRPLGSQLPALIFFIILAGGLSLALALLSWRFLESPFLRMKAFFPYSKREESRPIYGMEHASG